MMKGQVMSSRTAYAKLLGLILFAMVLMGAMPARAQGVDQGFVPGIQDLPLMNGLKSANSEPLIFDSPEGRIVVSPVSGTTTRRQVLEFYRRILPQLGWQVFKETSFRREGELLKLEFSAAQGGVLPLRFSLSPARKFTH